MLDLSEFDLLSNSNNTPILMSNNNEDNVNSNLNPTAIPFTPNFGMPASTNANPFQDPFVSNKQQDNQVPGECYHMLFPYFDDTFAVS